MEHQLETAHHQLQFQVLLVFCDPGQRMSFSAKLLPSGHLSAHPGTSLFFPTCRIWHFLLLNFMSLLSAHFSGLLRSLWMALCADLWGCCLCHPPLRKVAPVCVDLELDVSKWPPGGVCAAECVLSSWASFQSTSLSTYLIWGLHRFACEDLLEVKALLMFR